MALSPEDEALFIAQKTFETLKAGLRKLQADKQIVIDAAVSVYQQTITDANTAYDGAIESKEAEIAQAIIDSDNALLS